MTPTSVWFLIMLIMPLIVVVIFSFGERSPVGGYGPGFTLEQYANLPARFTAFKNTMTYAPLGTVISLIIAYPLAYYLAWEDVEIPWLNLQIQGQGMGLIGAWYAMIADVVLRSLLVVGRFWQGRWREIKV